MSKKLDRYEFIWKAIQKHGYKFDYRKVDYIDSHTNVCIICQKHGNFLQKPTLHLKGNGCAKCYGNIKLTTEEFIEKAKKVHGDKYNYSKVDYINSYTHVCIICPEHGEFWQQPKSHLNGCKCPKCSNSYIPTTEEWVEKAKKVHGDRYNYSKVNYINNRVDVCIICPEHGEFWQIPKNHLKGYNCPLCAATYNTNELKLYELLKENHPSVIYQYRNKDILKYMSYDFFIPKYNIAIEYQGRQHFVPIERFDGEEGFNDTIKRDKTKYELSLQNNINLLYFTYDKRNIPFDYMSEIITDEKELINKIKNIIENYGTMGTNNI